MSTHAVAFNRFGPDTYECNSGVEGGQLVEVDAATGKIKTCTADSPKVLGVALYTARPAGTAYTDTTGYNETRVDYSVPQEFVAVAWQGTYKLTATGAIAFGEKVVSAATGTVKPIPAVTTPTAGDVTNTRNIVGMCVEPGGISSGSQGLIRLSL